MAIQKVEFEFPDPDKISDKTDFVENNDGSFALKVEGRAADEEAKREKAKAKAKEDETPLADTNKVFQFGTPEDFQLQQAVNFLDGKPIQKAVPAPKSAKTGAAAEGSSSKK
jgi:hypothetical protein